jgi:hypothetical protein
MRRCILTVWRGSETVNEAATISAKLFKLFRKCVKLVEAGNNQSYAVADSFYVSRIIAF